jgi:hypothetical protein
LHSLGSSRSKLSNLWHQREHIDNQSQHIELVQSFNVAGIFQAPPKTTPNKLEPKTWLRFFSSFKDVEKISEANPTGIGEAKRGTAL